MPEFRLTQISDTHLARRMTSLTDNFHRVSEYIDATRPDLVINSGDLCLRWTDRIATISNLPKPCMTRFPSPAAICRAITTSATTRPQVGPPPSQPVTEASQQAFLSIFGEDRWRFEAAGWCFIGLNSLVMNTGLASEAEQFDWLASQLSGTVNGKPVALFLHKPLYLNAPDDPELVATSIRYVPMPARRRLIEMLRAVDLRLVASGHVHQRRDFTRAHIRQIWAPSAGFIIPDKKQEVIGIKEVGLVEYRFPARQLRGPSRQGAGPDRCRYGFADRRVGRKSRHARPCAGHPRF